MYSTLGFFFWQAASQGEQSSGLLSRLVHQLEHVGIVNFLMIGFVLFALGVAGVLTRRNIIVILMSIELIFNAANLNLVAFSSFWISKGVANSAINPYWGEIFTIFVIVVAVAEAAIGLGIVIALYRNRETIAIDEINLLKW